ncbi:hypothetical protein ASPVEDRAFT_52593 [Aspergillus versicolor CBS 583.65]|uniref:Sidoreflexin n=1 Tax=Aspergillus versicolor CBS 583.65 TaxID=1036611 RepID=A0A1L9PJP1_ASPVE|nr:uncharacterized protein ASPVEDRAFT_52593 [Aspergillus versicolor CBS 583.65]OJJ01693.1 hypothetical protein ASPVEDRAFT_52593 [Aspergillus versicolor CBS 583.65]
MSAPPVKQKELPRSQYDLNTYWGRVQHAAGLCDPRMAFASRARLQEAKQLVSSYRHGHIPTITPDVWAAKLLLDSTLHPDTGEPVFLPFRMSCYALSNLVVNAGMLTPGLSRNGIIFWQIMNQSLNVAINNANANKSSPLPYSTIAKSYIAAVSRVLSRLTPFAAVTSASALNVLLMRSDEVRQGIHIYPLRSQHSEPEESIQPLGKSQRAAWIAVSETAVSRILNAAPVMVIPPLVLLRIERLALLRTYPFLLLPVNLGLIFSTSLMVLPLAIAVFPQRQVVDVGKLEPEFWHRAGHEEQVEFNRGV